MQLSEHVQRQVLKFQQTEITEHHIYKRLAKKVTPTENAQIIEQIAEDELRHYNGWKKYTNQEVEPRWFMVWFYYWVSVIFGFTFGIKLMEHGEEAAQENYAAVSQEIPEAEKFQHEEDVHEERLIGMLDEERLQYAGSVVLGLNDALVELTGALAGLTLALQNVKLIALSGLITGIAASMSMAASEYLSTRSEETTKQPVRAADLYRHCLHHHCCPARHALPSLRKLHPGPGHHPDNCRDHHCCLQLLHFRRQGRTIPGAFFGNGRA